MRTLKVHIRNGTENMKIKIFRVNRNSLKNDLNKAEKVNTCAQFFSWKDIFVYNIFNRMPTFHPRFSKKVQSRVCPVVFPPHGPKKEICFKLKNLILLSVFRSIIFN